MNEIPSRNEAFIHYLESLASGQNRGALAALRRGLGQPPGTAAEMYPYVIPWLGDEPPAWRERAYYLTAALFAFHPSSTREGNLGNAFAHCRDPQGNNDALERRFTNLLSAHPDDLAMYLQQAISFLKSKEIPVNWQQLLDDLQSWGHPERYVQRRWAQAFWGRPAKPLEEQNQS